LLDALEKIKMGYLDEDPKEDKMTPRQRERMYSLFYFCTLIGGTGLLVLVLSWLFSR